MLNNDERETYALWLNDVLPMFLVCARGNLKRWKPVLGMSTISLNILINNYFN